MGITVCAGPATAAMPITVPRMWARRTMAINSAAHFAQRDDGHQVGRLSSVDEVVEVVADHLADDGPVDDAYLARGGMAEGVGGEAVDVAEATGAGLVEDGDGVAREGAGAATDG